AVHPVVGIGVRGNAGGVEVEGDGAAWSWAGSRQHDMGFHVPPTAATTATAASVGQLENGAVAVGPGVICRAIQTAGGVEDQTSTVKIIAADQRCQCGYGAAAMGQLEDNAITGGTAEGCYTVKIAAAVHSHITHRVSAVGAVKRYQGGYGATAVGQLED